MNRVAIAISPNVQSDDEVTQKSMLIARHASEIARLKAQVRSMDNLFQCVIGNNGESVQAVVQLAEDYDDAREEIQAMES